MLTEQDLSKSKDKGIKYLTKQNDVFSLLVKQIGFIEFEKRKLNFEALVRIIINQQLSGHVAKVIFSRLKKLFKNNEDLKPNLVSEIEIEKLRNIGVSNSKIIYIKELSVKFLEAPNFVEKWFNLNDLDASLEIQKLKGFGPWSANIILLFYMGRTDIFPFDDSTLKKAHSNIYGIPITKNLEELNWAKPYRSILALYFWRWVDNGMIKL